MFPAMIFPELSLVGLEPWNFMTFHILGIIDIIAPTDSYFSEG